MIGVNTMRRSKVGMFELLRGCALLLLSFKWAGAQFSSSERLLNAYNAPLSALTTPHTYYFLEFPIPGTAGSGNNYYEFPMCGDGSPYSFIFRRGTDAHLSKLIVEFEGGPACLNEDSQNDDEDSACINIGKRQTPWHDYTLKQGSDISSSFKLPSLGICTGVPSGFMRQGESILFDENDNPNDTPLFLRGENKKKGWWDELSGEHSDIDDWSYILLPHCTLDWHLGRQTGGKTAQLSNGETTLHHRGGFNTQAVLDWVTTQFSSIGGLDALVTVSGGKAGGCHDDHSASASGIASLSFAQGAASAGIVPLNSALAVLDGASLWDKRIPSNVDMVQQWNADLDTSGDLMYGIAKSIAMSSTFTQVAWVSSSTYDAITAAKELAWVTQFRQYAPDSFHIYVPTAVNTGNDIEQQSCPIYTFPKDSTDDSFSDFLSKMTKHMSWPLLVSDQLSTRDDMDNSPTAISFFSVALILLGVFIASWGSFFAVRYQRLRKNLPAPRSPSDVWFIALTRFPVAFLFFSIFIPTLLSYIAFARDDYQIKVNLDFDTYLDIDTKEEQAAMQYSKFKSYHYNSIKREEENCGILYSNNFDSTSAVNRIQQRRTEEQELGDFLEERDASLSNKFDDNTPSMQRNLQDFGLYRSPGGRVTLSFFYQSRNGGTVFTPEILESIRQFEQSIYDFPGFEDYCYGMNECFPFDSVIPYFYPDGENLVDDIDRVLRGFLGSKSLLGKVDKYFGRENLGSNITLTQVWFNNVADESELYPLLEKFHRELLWKIDHDRPLKHPEMVVTWGNSYMEKLESSDALSHDALWSVASLCFIGLMVFLKVRNIFVALSAVLCLVLAFTSALYWCENHFEFKELTMMHVAGLFVMLGIGADDIFLTIDTFHHTKVDHTINNERSDGTTSEPQCCPSEESDIIRRRMISSYRTAGSMMLVSSLTTAICFFSNSFGVLTAIRDFGTYMGMVVLINYVHVMTVLPSAILVNELHIHPFLQKMLRRMYAKPSETPQNSQQHPNPGDTEMGLVLPYQSDQVGKGPSSSAETNASQVARQLTIAETNSSDESNQDLSLDSDQQAGVTHSLDAETCIGVNDPAVQQELVCEETILPQEPNQDLTGDHNIIIENASEHGRSNRDSDFLDRMSEMTVLDRWLVGRYAPFVHKWRVLFILVSLVMAITFGALAVRNFSLYDGTIIVFKEDYNLGRLQKIVDEYFNEELVKLYQEEGADFDSLLNDDSGGNGGGSSTSNGQSDTTDSGDSSSTAGDSSSSAGDTFITDFVYPSISPSKLPTSGPTVSSTSIAITTEQNTATSSPTQASISDEVMVIAAPTPFPSIPGPVGSNPVEDELDNSNEGLATPTSPSISDEAVVAQPTPNPIVPGSVDPNPVEGDLDNSNEGLATPTVPSLSDEAVVTQPTPNPAVAPMSGNGIGGADPVSQNSPESEVVPTTDSSSNNFISEGSGWGSGNTALAPNTDASEPTLSNNQGFTQYGAPPAPISMSSPTPMPTLPMPTLSPTKQDCGWGGLFCLSDSNTEVFKQRELFVVSLVWGLRPTKQVSSLWTVKKDQSSSDYKDEEMDDGSIKGSNLIDPSEPHIQEWLLEIITLARADAGLRVNDEVTWIEALRDFAVETGIGFPLPKELFIGTIQLMKSQSSFFRALVKREIATDSPGITGDFLYTSISVLSEVPMTEGSWSTKALEQWTNFTEYVNEILPDDMPPMLPQSTTFLDAQRTKATVDSTVTTYFVANGLCLLVILLFTQNILLTVMIMTTLLLIFLCLGGLLFNVFLIEFGPVEALGVSIFVGLSANYSLHIAHAYHRSDINERKAKIQRTSFIIGSPIIASALSTIGGSAFLFACRSWLLIELGILICSIIALSLFFSMLFLMAWLAMFGPLPRQLKCDEQKNGHGLIHSWDFKNIIFWIPMCSKNRDKDGDNP